MLVLYYDNPKMKFHNLGPMPVERHGNSYKNSYFALTLSEDHLALNGRKSFDGHDLPVALKRGALPASTPSPEEDTRIAQPVWTFNTAGAIWSSPAIADGLIYFGSSDKKIYAIDAKSGKRRWEFATQGAVMGRPTIDGDAVYALSDDGYLYRLGRRDGKLQWRFDTRGNTPRDLPSATSTTYDYLASSATLADGVVYIGSADKRLYAVDARHGTERWHFDTQGSVRSIPALSGDRVYFGSYDHNVYALNSKTGALVWKLDTLEPVVSSPLVSGGVVYIGSRSSDLFAIDAATGIPRWKFFYWSSWVESSAAMKQDALYIGSSDYQQVFAIEAANGKERWRFGTGGSPWGTPAVAENRVYVGTVQSTGYFIDHRGGFFALDRASGKAVWRYPMPAIAGAFNSGVASSPAVDHGFVYFGGLDGNFYAFAAQ